MTVTRKLEACLDCGVVYVVDFREGSCSCGGDEFYGVTAPDEQI